MESTEERILHYQRGIERSVTPLDKPRLLHCIKALSKLPVTMRHLKDTGIGRTVNSLRKLEDGVGDASKRLVTKWKEMVSNAPDSGESDEACVPDDPDNYEGVNYEQEHDEDEKEEEDGDEKEGEEYNGISRPKALERPALSPPMVIDVNISPEQEPAPDEEEEEPEETNHSQSSKHTSSKDKDSKKDSKSSSSSGSKSSESKEKRESSKVSKSSKDNGHEEHKKKDKDKSKSSSSSSKKHSSSSSSSSEMKKRKVEESSDDESNRKKQRLQSVCENESDNDEDEVVDEEEPSNFVIDDEEDDNRANGESSEDEQQQQRDNDGSDKHRDASSLKHGDSKSKSKDKDRQRSSSSSSSSKTKSKDEKSKTKDESKHKSKSSSNGKDKEKHKSRSDEKGKAKEKKEHKKSKEHKEKKKSKKSAIEGIDSMSGTSFDDALGMGFMPPPTKKKKEKEKEPSKPSSSKGESSASPSKSKSKSEPKPMSTPPEDEGSPDDSLRLLSPNVKLEPLSGDINEEVDLASTLPEPSPYYKPLPQINHAQRRADEEDMLTRVINAKVQRTKVYSGNKSGWTNVPTLQEICIRLLIENIDALEYTGGVPFDILQPILERASAEQLIRLEYYNPYLIEDTDPLWKFHCNKIFKSKQREEMESWREMYERCVTEREAKFKAITANIKQAIDKSAPVRSTKLAYVDHFVKPPRNVLRQQAKYGTAKVATSASDLKKKLITGSAGPSGSGSGGSSANVERISVPPPPASRSRPPTSHPIKKTKAPLMAKALQAIKGRYKR